MNHHKPARHGYRARRKYDAGPAWEAEKYRLLTLYRGEFIQWLYEGRVQQQRRDWGRRKTA